jgi:hypothetical protein
MQQAPISLDAWMPRSLDAFPSIATITSSQHDCNNARNRQPVLIWQFDHLTI